MAAVDHIEDIARTFWESWATWRKDQGWSLGMDRPESKMSPYLVHSWDGLDENAKDWFRHHVALVLHAAQPYTEPGSTPQAPSAPASAPSAPPAVSKAVAKLEAAMKALGELKTQVAERKVRTALKLLKGEPLRRRPKKT